MSYAICSLHNRFRDTKLQTLQEGGCFLENFAFDVLNLWKSTSWLRLLLPNTFQLSLRYLEYFRFYEALNMSMVVSMLNENHACNVLANNVQTNFTIYRQHANDTVPTGKAFECKLLRGLGFQGARVKNRLWPITFLFEVQTLNRLRIWIFYLKNVVLSIKIDKCLQIHYLQIWKWKKWKGRFNALRKTKQNKITGVFFGCNPDMALNNTCSSWIFAR